MDKNRAVLPLLDDLLALSEKRLQAEIIEPLLRAMGYRNVRDNSGPGEKGKDLIATKQELLRDKFFAIQIKRFKLTGKAGAKKGLGSLLDQLRQALEEPALDPTTGQLRVPDGCLFITPYAIPMRAREAFLRRTREPLFRNLELIDGPRLLDLLTHFSPDLLGGLSIEAQYRFRVSNHANTIQEAPVAFGLGGPLLLDNIYVDASVDQGGQDLPAIASRPLIGERSMLTIAEAMQLRGQYSVWIGQEGASIDACISAAKRQLTKQIRQARANTRKHTIQRWARLVSQLDDILANTELPRADRTFLARVASASRKSAMIPSARKQLTAFRKTLSPLERLASRLTHTRFDGVGKRLSSLVNTNSRGLKSTDDHLSLTEDNLRQAECVEVDLDAILSVVQSRIQGYLLELHEISKPACMSDQATATAMRGIELLGNVRRLLHLDAVRRLWKAHRAPITESCSLASTALTNIRTHIFVVGRPGAGKTTMLRRYSQIIAQHSYDDLPVFLPLVSVHEPSYSGLVRALVKGLNEHGYRDDGKSITPTIGTRLLDSGRLRICLDGLDETGDSAVLMMKAIERLASRHPKTQLVLSTRDTAAIPDWIDAFCVRLATFSDAQVTEFVGKWFSAEPSSKQDLLKWLSENVAMRKAAATPLICALLCSLYHAGAEMPSTEVELYRRRFELLLGRWEEAKAFVPLPKHVRQKYHHFLMALGIYLQTAEKRSASHEVAVSLGRRYHSPGVHGHRDSLVEDFVRRGILEREMNGRLSFGHLTYQEFMAAEWLAQQNPIAFIWSRLLTPWWNKTLEFYAALKMDITPLVRKGLRFSYDERAVRRLARLATLAPLTLPKLVERLESKKRGTSIEPDWDAGPPHLDIL